MRTRLLVSLSVSHASDRILVTSRAMATSSRRRGRVHTRVVPLLRKFLAPIVEHEKEKENGKWSESLAEEAV